MIDLLDLVGGWLGIALTLFILSYLIGDNPFYRIAVNLLVGATAALALLVVVRNVFIPQAQQLMALNLGVSVGWLLAVLLITKMLSPNFGPGRLSLAVLIGIGVAVSIAGALTGTLLPLADITAFELNLVGSSEPAQLFSDVIVFVGVVCVLLSFHYGARLLPDGKNERHVNFRLITYVGQIFIGVALGLMYGGALVASIGYLADRLIYLWGFIQNLLK
ncbi:MAG: hypothetical protein JNL09_00845 [Anaerolineales bacterium]|nr:hypothetical protein [Anaerolineales bacterium]